MCDLDNPIFKDEKSAREYLETTRWPDGPFCPHCGSVDARKLEGKSHRDGLYQCKDCRKQYTVTVGTLFERSKVPLHKWLLATYLLCSSKKGMSTHQLHRMLGVTYKTAWFMTHRIREAMREPVLPEKLGGGGSTVEADETYWGQKEGTKKARGGFAHKEEIVTLVERNGRARSFHRVKAENLKSILKEQLEQDTHIMTDQARHYRGLDKHFPSHQAVNHSIGEYVRGDAHTNTIEGYFSILKRGLTGTYQHVSAKHLKRYLGEFDFRYNHRTKLGVTDKERAEAALRGIEGKRLTYRGPRSGQEPSLC